MKVLTEKEIDLCLFGGIMITKDGKQETQPAKYFRLAFSMDSFSAFCQIYLRGKFVLQMASFHEELFNDLESLQKFIAILGFRGSAKSTIVEAFVLWAIVTKRHKLAVMIGATDSDAKRNLANIRKMIESSKELQEDFGILVKKKSVEMSHKWSEEQLNLCDGFIVARSRGQNIRGMKFTDDNMKDHKPDLIVGDDIENTDSTKSQEQRKKTRQWFFAEVLAGMKPEELGLTRVIIIGNLVHKDCLLANLEKNGKDIVKVKRFPLIDANGYVTWRAMYPTRESIEAKKQEIMLSGAGLGLVIWAREFLLKIVNEEDQIIKETDIQYYDESWLQKKFLRSGVGVDLAISEKQTADCTAMIPAMVVQNEYGEERILILANFVNERLDFHGIVSNARLLKARLRNPVRFFVEGNQFQRVATQVFMKNGIDAVNVFSSQDKKFRLNMVAPYIKSGIVLFPKQGAEELLTQIIGLGVEPHDDACDGCVNVIDGLVGNNRKLLVS